MADEELRTQREILRSIENNQIKLTTIMESQTEKSKDHEARIRSLETSKNKLMAGVAVAGSTGVWASIKSFFGF